MDRLLEGLTEDQRLAVTIAAPRLRILAGAGSGKTRVLTRRIAHHAKGGALEPAHTLAVTFTRKAAGELRQRLHSLGLEDDVSAGTFHAQAYAQLRARWADQGVRPPKLLDRRGKLLHRVIPRSLPRPDQLAVQTEIDWATARRITPDAYPAAAERAERRLATPPAQVAEYYRTFVEEKRRRKLVDFDDLLELTIHTMADPRYAQTVHWRFRHLFVDEFQDVNPLQYQLLRAWVGPECTLCVVGDPNQAIYSWNGADAGYLERFDEHFPGAQTVELRRNFRSTPQILAAAAAIQGEAARLEASRPDGALPTVRSYSDDREEALGIARHVRDNHVPGGRWAHQAVLVRTNAQSALIADALRNAKIPVSIRDGASVLDEPGVKERLAHLQNDRSPLRTLVIDLRTEADAAVDPDDDVPRPSDELAPHTAATLLSLAEDQLALDPGATASDFAHWIRATLGSDSTAGADAVDIVTFHAAKGLEWSVVHIAGVEDGLVPITHARSPEARAEERRLFYVAVTRAKDRLYCSWARQRRFGDRAMDRSASIFLRDIAARTMGDGDVRTASSSGNLERIRALRDRLGVQAEQLTPDQRRERLREWRRSTARVAGVPAFVVFNDRTLDALVEATPRTADDLAAIPGLGPVKISRYGDALLELLATS